MRAKAPTNNGFEIICIWDWIEVLIGQDLKKLDINALLWV
jgi:hypothetical protein